LATNAAANLRAGNGVLGVTAGVAPALSGEGLVVVLTKVHAELGPGVEVALGGDSSATGTLVDTVGDVLGEGGGADDGRLVHLGVLPDVVAGAIAGDGADLLALSGAGTVGGVLLDVVLNKGVGGPAVGRDKDGASSCRGRALEVDLPGGSSLPALTNDEVTGVGELNRVAVVGRLEVDVAASLVVLVVVLAADKAGGVVQLEVGKVRDGSRSSEGASSGGKRNSDGGEGNHFDG
jgi:hypothetical protein